MTPHHHEHENRRHHEHEHAEHADHENETHIHAEDGIQPAVYSFTRALVYTAPVGGSEPEAACLRLINAIFGWSERYEHLIGHIKARLSSGGQSLWLSNTGADTSRRMSAAWESVLAPAYELALTAIIYGPSDEMLEEVVDSEAAIYLA